MYQVAIIVIVVVSLGIILCVFLRTLRKRRARPRLLPGTFLKRRWEAWTARGTYSSRLQDNVDDPARTSYTGPRGTEMTGTGVGGDGGTVARNTSVRSVATLPAYSPAARETERILGREGERAGVDLVLEYPETVDEEEARREQEMSSLHAIRVARRAEAAEREERRRARREARERGASDGSRNNGGRNHPGTERHERTRNGSSASNAATDTTGAVASEPTAAALIAHHRTRDHSRRVSSVNYYDLGVAYHDGSRLRASSTESDRRPLLDTTASHSTVTLDASTSLHGPHERGLSTSSVRSFESAASDDLPPPPAAVVRHGHQRSGSRNGSGSGSGSGSGGGTDFEFVSLSQAQSHSRSPSGSSRATPLPTPGTEAESAAGDYVVAGDQPPLYEHLNLDAEEAPPYESPVRTGPPTLPPVTAVSNTRLDHEAEDEVPGERPRLPSILVTSSPDDPRLPAEPMDDDMAAEINVETR